MKKGLFCALLSLSVSGLSFSLSIREALDAGVSFDTKRLPDSYFNIGDIDGKYIEPVMLQIDESSNATNITDLDGLQDIKGIGDVNVLHLFDTRLKNISANAFRGLENILELAFLSNDQLRYVDQNAFSGLDKLWHLSLSSNQIQAIHNDTFKGLTSLRKVVLSDNPISENNISALKKLYPNIKFIAYAIGKDYDYEREW